MEFPDREGNAHSCIQIGISCYIASVNWAKVICFAYNHMNRL